MLKTLTVALAIAIIAPLSLTVALASDSSADTGCWDEYNALGTKRVGMVIPNGVARSQCTTPSTCYWGFDTAGRRNALFVPHKWSPGKCLVRTTPTTTSTSTTTTTATPTTTAPPVTTVAPASTTAPSTTVAVTAAPTTVGPTTVAPTTTAATTTTTTTTVVAPPAPNAGAPFVADFTGNTGLEQFDTGVFHRDDVMVATNSWTGDHDANCGDPSTQRTVQRSQPAQSFYLCRDHLMSSVGDTSGYSIAWFAPKQTFRADTHSSVSWDVNVTDLGNRQWWEVSLVPTGTPFLATVDWVASTASIDTYDRGSIVVGKGPFGNDGNIVTQGVQRDPLGWGHVCGSGGADPEGCASKAIRRTFTITDNRNGTVTVDFLGKQYTYPGSFPSEFKVYFKDHSYTPDKDGIPVGHTWHWDNIVVR